MEESSSRFTWKEPRKLMTRSTRLKLETIFPQNKTFWHQHGVQKKERLADWQGHGDLSCSPVLICLQAPVLLLAGAQRWLLSVSSQRCLFSVSLSLLSFCALSCLCLLYPLPPPLCISSVSDRGRVVCDWGQVGLCIERGWLIPATSKVAADFLSSYSTWFQFVSVSCWAPGWVGGVWEGYGCEMPREDPAILTEEHQLLIVDTNFLFPSWQSTLFIEHKVCHAFFQRSFGFYTPQTLSPVSCVGKTQFFGLLCAGMTWSVCPPAVFSPTLALSPRSMPGWCQDRKIFQIIARLKKPSQSRRTL